MSPSESDLAERAAQAKLVWISILDSRIPPEGHTSLGCSAPELDVDLQVLDEIVLTAKRRRNAHVAWPCKLPFEVLAMILSQLKCVWSTRMTRLTEEEKEHMARCHGYDWREILNEAYGTRDRLGWLNVTHVCSQIRKVALASPYLWSEMECSELGPGFVNLMILRSAELPLHLTINYKSDILYHCIDWTERWLTPTICNRLRSLELINFPEEDLPAIIKCIPILPSLTEIILKGPSDVSDIIHYALVDVEFPLASPQQLSRLAFHNCFPSPSNSMFSSQVTDLTLSSTSLSDSPCIPSVDEVLKALSSLTQLQRLRLVNVLRKTDQSSSTILKLPHSFRKLEYRAGKQRLGFAPVTDLTARIELPGDVQVILGFDADDDDGGYIDGMSDFACAVGATFSATRRPSGSPWSLHLAHHEAYILLSDEHPTPQFTVDALSGGGITTKDSYICLSRPSPAYLTIPDLNGLFQLLPLAHLSSLSLDKETLDTLFSKSDSDATERAWSPMTDKLLAAPALRHLLLPMGWSVNATHLLAKLAEVRNQDGRDIPLVFPSLETIVVGVDIQLGVDEDIEVRAKELLAPISAALETAVDARRNCALPISEARIERRLKYTYAWEIEIENMIGAVYV